MVQLSRFAPSPDVQVFAKMEGWNPTGSVKDRIVLAIVREAERRGALKSGDVIVEASTGNTGIALSMLGRALRYPVHIVMPENVFAEIPRTIAAYGAEIHSVPGDLGVTRAIQVAREMALREGWFMLDQFSSKSNIRAHYEGTAPEILSEVDRVDIFVAGLGTGGTLMGVGRRLKEANPEVKVIAVEPHPGNQVQGLKSLADGFLPPLLDYSVLDGKILVRSGDAFRATAQLMEREAIFAGVSSGAVLHAAMKLAPRIKRGNIVLLFADSGWKYLSTKLWTDAPEPDRDEDMEDVILWCCVIMFYLVIWC
jgi:cysteine synthase B